MKNKSKKKKATSKYNVSKNKAKRTYKNVIYDSEVEMRYYRDVIEPKIKSGDIIECELQKSYELQPKFKYNGKTVLPIKYVSDFYVVYSDGSKELIDIKGLPDSVALMKRKMFWYIYPDIKYSWICYSKIDGGWCDYDYVKQQRTIRKKQRNAEKEKNTPKEQKE